MIDLSDCNTITDICKKYIGEVNGNNKKKIRRLLKQEGIDPDQ